MSMICRCKVVSLHPKRERVHLVSRVRRYRRLLRYLSQQDCGTILYIVCHHYLDYLSNSFGSLSAVSWGLGCFYAMTYHYAHSTASIINTNSSRSFNQSLLWFQREIQLSNSSLRVKPLSCVYSRGTIKKSYCQAIHLWAVISMQDSYSTNTFFCVPKTTKTAQLSHFWFLLVNCCPHLSIKSTGWQAVITFLKFKCDSLLHH